MPLSDDEKARMRYLQLKKKKALSAVKTQEAEEEPKKTEGTFTQRLGFGGTPEQRTLFGLPQDAESKIFPRAVETREKAREDKKVTAKEFLQTAGSGMADLLSLPGRAATAAPTLLPGGEKFGEALERKEAPKDASMLRKIAESVTRDPAAIPVGVATAGLGPLLKAGKVPAVLAGAAEGVVGAGTKQIEEFGETGKVSPLKAAAEVGASALTAGALDKLSPVLKKKATNIITKIINPKKKAKLMGFDAEDIFKLKVDGTIKQTIKKAGTKKNVLIKEVDDIVENYMKNNADKKIFVNKHFSNALDKINAGKLKNISADEAKTARSSIKEIFKELQSSNDLGNLDANGLRRLKNKLGKMAFRKTTDLSPDADIAKRKAIKTIWQDVVDDFYKLVPDAKGKSSDIHKLDVIEGAAKEINEKIKEKGGKLFNLSLGDLVALGAVSSFGPIPAGAVTAGVVGKKALTTGPGAQAVRFTGKAIGRPSIQLGGAAAAGKTMAELLKSKKDEEKDRKLANRKIF